MIVPRVWTDYQGMSHFAELEVGEQDRSLVSGLPVMSSTPLLPITGFRLVATTLQAMAQGWHPAPARQFVLVVKGSIIVEVSDGETRQLNAGLMIFFEDLDGRGHLNRIVDDQDILLAFLLLPDNWHP
jgi:hypothetical protein